MKMPFSDNTYDAVYAIEATCHAPDAVRSSIVFLLPQCFVFLKANIAHIYNISSLLEKSLGAVNRYTKC